MYPSQVVNAIKTFLPSDISPFLVEGPSAIRSPSFTFSPFTTTGLWLIHVPPFVLLNFLNLYVSNPPFSFLIVISSPVTFSTIPLDFATTVVPESFAALYSIPVPTIGASGINNGTAWRCMFDPINERLASSCSKKGIIAAATDTNCFGDTSTKSTLSLSTTVISSLNLTLILSWTNSLFSFNGSEAWAIIYLSSSSACIYTTSSVTFPVLWSTFLYGVSMKPYSFIIANDDNAEINPTFGPSGDSIGHNLP